MGHRLLPVLLWIPLLACPSDGTLPDDGDDDDTAPFECGLASDGSGGVAGDVWYEVDGFGTPGDGVPDHEMLVHRPADLDAASPAPVVILVGRRMPLNRPENETIMLEPMPAGLAMADFADEQGWIAALPLPRPGGSDGRLSWSDEEVDQDFFRAALDLLEATYNVDRDRIWLFGSSAGGVAATYLGWRHADRVTAILNHAGYNPFTGNWPSTPWDDDCAAMFVHDEDDPVVDRASVEDGAAMYEDAGQHVERAYDYDAGHQWDHEVMNALMADFFPRTCNWEE